MTFAFVDGAWEPGLMARRCAHDLDLPLSHWVVKVAEKTAEARRQPKGNSLALEQLVEQLLRNATDQGDAREAIPWLHGRDGPNVWPGPPAPPERLSMARGPWPVRPLENAAELAEALNLDPASLSWFADTRSLERTARDENLRHYDYHWLAKRSGGRRLIQAPKQNLKEMQRWVLRKILDHIPPHDAAHGFRHGRNIQSYAAPHTGREWVLRMDLSHFFCSVPVARVRAVFEAAGYPNAVTRLLVGLCTNATPPHVLTDADGDVELVGRLRGPHLPQGAPTSPTLANLAAFGLDTRLQALASRFDARYTRYADDLAFSGESMSHDELDRMVALVRGIVNEQGLRVREDKTSVRRKHQRQVLTGMVVNKHLNLHRRDLDRLRAEVYEAATKGPAVANRRSHPQYRAS